MVLFRGAIRISYSPCYLLSMMPQKPIQQGLEDISFYDAYCKHHAICHNPYLLACYGNLQLHIYPCLLLNLRVMALAGLLCVCWRREPSLLPCPAYTVATLVVSILTAYYALVHAALILIWSMSVLHSAVALHLDLKSGSPGNGSLFNSLLPSE